MTQNINRQILLASRPYGAIKDENFGYREEAIPEPGEGQALVRNLYLSLDPTIRGWMSPLESYLPPIPVGGVMRGSTIGEVVSSNIESLSVGDKVLGMGGWQDYYLASPEDLPRRLPDNLPVPLTNFLSVLGITGLTAYFGLLDVGRPKAGETVVVSAAAGATGSVVGQIAKIKGCRVVGLAGTDEKCEWLTSELGFDHAINYKARRVPLRLRKACPDKIDIYYDNVGGDLLNLALGQINLNGRVVVCGAISRYNSTEMPPGPGNYLMLISRRARMEGFLVLDYADRYLEGSTQLAQWLLEGRIKHREEIIEGLENAQTAINKLFDGSNKGKLIVKVD